MLVFKLSNGLLRHSTLVACANDRGFQNKKRPRAKVPKRGLKSDLFMIGELSEGRELSDARIDQPYSRLRPGSMPCSALHATRAVCTPRAASARRLAICK